MVDSLRKSELTVNLPIKHGDLSLSLEVTNTIFSIMPFKGKHHKIASRLKEKFNIDLPSPNLRTFKGEASIYWVGLDQWFFVNSGSVDLFHLISDDAATTDQSDGWIKMSLIDTQNKDVLARLCPVQPIVETVVRTKLAGMMSIIFFTENGAELFVMRSMIESAVNEIEIAIKSVAAQKGINE